MSLLSIDLTQRLITGGSGTSPVTAAVQKLTVAPSLCAGHGVCPARANNGRVAAPLARRQTGASRRVFRAPDVPVPCRLRRNTAVDHQKAMEGVFDAPQGQQRRALVSPGAHCFHLLDGAEGVRGDVCVIQSTKAPTRFVHQAMADSRILSALSSMVRWVRGDMSAPQSTTAPTPRERDRGDQVPLLLCLPPTKYFLLYFTHIP